MRLSEVKLLKGIPFSPQDERWLTFSSLAEQEQFFTGHSVQSFYDLSFVKGFAYKKIKLEVNYDKIILCNYVMFRNWEYADKWFYAYITNIEYISDGCTEIDIKIDYFQTYINKIQFLPCFIDRQMTKDDDIRNTFNLEEEELPIETSFYKVISANSFLIDEWSVVIQYKPNLVLEFLSGSTNISGSAFSGYDDYNYKDFRQDTINYDIGAFIPNIYWSGCAFKTYRIRNTSDINNLALKIWGLEIAGYTITNAYMIPTNMISGYTYYTSHQPPTHPYNRTDKNIDIYTSQFIPINNKTYTYIYYIVDNNSGNSKTYQTKDFITEYGIITKFEICLQGVNKTTGITYPTDYITTRDITIATQWAYGVDLGDIPETTWNEQGAKPIVGAIKTLVGIGGSVAGVPQATGLIGSGVKDVIQKQASRGGVGSSTLNIINGVIGWTYNMCCPLHIDQVDDYFSVYGYKANRIDTPNILNRRRWNYIKCKDANIQGDIPIEAKNEIADALNKGITFWHDKNNYDYLSTRAGESRLYNDIISNNSGLTDNYTIF